MCFCMALTFDPDLQAKVKGDVSRGKMCVIRTDVPFQSRACEIRRTRWTSSRIFECLAKNWMLK